MRRTLKWKWDTQFGPVYFMCAQAHLSSSHQKILKRLPHTQK